MGRRLPLAAVLAPFGALAAHAAGYGLAAAGHAGRAGHAGHAGHAHAYLGAVAAVAVPVAAGVVAWLACGRRGSRRALPPVRVLVATQAAVFGAQEVAERVAAGVPLADLAASPAVRLGLAAQVVAAAGVLVAVRLARATRWAVAAALARRARATARDAGASPLAGPVLAPPRPRPSSPATRRGPPPVAALA